MNARTRDAFDEFIDSIEAMAPQLMNVVSYDLVKQMVDRGEELKNALDKDETIP